MKDKAEIIESLMYRMEEEGFWYCFDGYSDWLEVEDEEFHKLRKEFLSVAGDLIKRVKVLAVMEGVPCDEFQP